MKQFVNKVTMGDCLTLIKKIPNETIDVIITDPPYGLNKEGVYNDEDLSIFYKILPECYRVLKNDTFFITFFSTKLLPNLFKNNPFTYFWQMIFYSPRGEVRSPIGLTKYMSCFIFKKGNPKMTQVNKDLFEHIAGTKMIEPDEGYIAHPTPKPKHFIRDMLKMFTKEDDLVLDPFIGSGSTALACKQLNRNFIGFELNSDYVKLANKRLVNTGDGFANR